MVIYNLFWVEKDYLINSSIIWLDWNTDLRFNQLQVISFGVFYMKGVFSDSSNLFITQICRYKTNKIISKFLIDHNFVFTNNTWFLCIILLSWLLCCIKWLGMMIYVTNAIIL